MIEKIFIIIVSATFSAVLTTLVAVLISPRYLRSMVLDAIKQHTDVWHTYTVNTYVEKEIDKHKSNCQASKSIADIHKAVSWLVYQAGGDLNSLPDLQ